MIVIELHGYEQLNEYLFKIIDDIFIPNQDLLKLLKYSNIDPLKERYVYDEMTYNYIFPYLKDPNFSNEIKNNLFIHFPNIDASKSGKFNDIILEIDVCCDDENQRTYYGDRKLKIMSEVEKSLGNTRSLGLGKLRRIGSHEIKGKGYTGYLMRYKILNIN